MNIKEILIRVGQVAKCRFRKGMPSNKCIAAVLKVSPSTSCNWIPRGTVPFDELLNFATENNVSYEWILTGKFKEGEPSVDTTRIEATSIQPYSRPISVISWVQAGELTEAIDCWPEGVSGADEPVFVHRNVSSRTFALRVMGDSMTPRYMEGDIIVIDPEIGVSTGDPCVAKVAGEVTFKIYYENGTEIRLKAMNPKYPDMVFPKNGAVDFRVVGKVIELIAKI